MKLSDWWSRLELGRRLQAIPMSTMQAAQRLQQQQGRRTGLQRDSNDLLKKYIMHVMMLMSMALAPLFYTTFLYEGSDHSDGEADLRAFVQWRVSSHEAGGVPPYLQDIQADAIKNKAKYIIKKYDPHETISQMKENCMKIPGTDNNAGHACVTETMPESTEGNENFIDPELYNSEPRPVYRGRRDLTSVLITVTGIFATCGIMMTSLQHVRDSTAPNLLQEAWTFWRGIENTLSIQNNLATLIKQMLFLTVCEKVFLPGQRLAALYTLMFCTIITYCIGYAAELVRRQQWCLFVTVGESTSIRHLALSTTNIVLEWTKAVTFITTITFMLLILGLEKGLDNYSPSIPYLTIAFIYWVCSERVCQASLTKVFLTFRLEYFESLEEEYMPLLLEAIQLSMTMIFTAPCVALGHFKLGAAGVLMSRVHYLQLCRHYSRLSTQLASIGSFRSASSAELSDLDDRCAICLDQLETARVTVCQHYYHADCLLQLIKANKHSDVLRCPICHTELLSKYSCSSCT